MKPKLIDIPSGPQGGLVYNPDPYKSTPCPYRLRDAVEYARSAGKDPSRLTDEEWECFRILGK